ncbi:MAG: hypothetical protein ACYC6L_13545 [Anaerolineae bacterium]
MRAKLRLLSTVVLVLALAGLTGLPAAAQGPTGPTLYNQVAVTGSLAGNHAGAFWYAYINYQGGGDVITLTLNFTPADPVTRLGVGFNVYGPDNGQLIGVGKPNLANDAGIRTLTYAAAAAQVLLVQVYNYIDGANVNFSLTGEGLPQAQLPVVPGASGGLAGSAGGAFARYTVIYPAAAATSLVMNFTPSDPLISRGVTFRVYGPDGLVGIAQATGTAGQAALTFTPAAGVQYLVQVENYIPGIDVSFSFQGTAALAPEK